MFLFVCQTRLSPVQNSLSHLIRYPVYFPSRMQKCAPILPPVPWCRLPPASQLPPLPFFLPAMPDSCPPALRPLSAVSDILLKIRTSYPRSVYFPVHFQKMQTDRPIKDSLRSVSHRMPPHRFLQRSPVLLFRQGYPRSRNHPGTCGTVQNMLLHPLPRPRDG